MLSCERSAFAILTKIARQFVQDFVVEFIDINANIDRGNECAMKRLREHVVGGGMSRQCYNLEILSISGALHESHELRVSHMHASNCSNINSIFLLD